MRRNAVVKLFWRIHPKVYQWSSGRIGNRIMGLPVLLLTTRGRKTNQERTKALMYLPLNQDFVVIASNLGDDYHPAWWLNLQADPEARVQVGDRHFSVQAREAEGTERQEIWQILTSKLADYDKYQAMTNRRIPVVVLQRQPESRE